MKNPKPLLRVSVIGTVLVALCCFTPILVILLVMQTFLVDMVHR